jgi:hypothetical protein
VIGRRPWLAVLEDAEPRGARGRFQAVDTAAAYRRRGICSRLLVEAARRSAEHVCGVCHAPDEQITG